MSLSEDLNEANATPEVQGGEVTLNLDECQDENLVEALATVEGTVEEHPEGAKRGGYVSVVYRGDESATWDDVDCQWVSDDDEDD